jgi:hypothetical protein
MKRQQHTFTDITSKVDSILSSANSLGFKRIDSTDIRESHVHDKLEAPSNYEHICSRTVAKNNALFNDIEDLAEAIGLEDKVLVSSLMQLQPGDFLTWNDVDYWQENAVGKFLSIALTSGNSIEFKDGTVKVPQYTAIEFNTGDVHCIQPVKTKQAWLVLMIPDHFDLV